MAEQRRYPRWTSASKVYLYSPEGGSECCRVRDMSASGLFIERPYPELPHGAPVEMAFIAEYSQRFVKVYRRSGYVVRLCRAGLAVRFLAGRSRAH